MDLCPYHTISLVAVPTLGQSFLPLGPERIEKKKKKKKRAIAHHTLLRLPEVLSYLPPTVLPRTTLPSRLTQTNPSCVLIRNCSEVAAATIKPSIEPLSYPGPTVCANSSNASGKPTRRSSLIIARMRSQRRHNYRCIYQTSIDGRDVDCNVCASSSQSVFWYASGGAI